ncbi:Pancreatic triacylglycerol lipase [Frankliniella fusca]|uniref:Pancreatic triacylglycerol lipase n=1 Tax=Frankliniella fusca TaxID=407009 RepID=A0AAE1LIU4_9NEOP|nr:Pancreatic triacylglycerol lipase [Frankliniella fusca]
MPVWPVAPRGASLLNVGNPLRFRFGLPGLQAEFSTSFGIGDSGSSGGADSMGRDRDIITGSSDGFGRAGGAGGAAGAGRSIAWGSGLVVQGAMDLPTPWGWLGAGAAGPAGAGAGARAGQGVGGGGAVTWLLDSEERADMAPAEEDDIPVAGGDGGGQVLNILGGSEGIRFTMFTRQSSSEERISARDPSTLLKSTFNPKRKTKIIIHGFNSNQNPGSGGDYLKDAFLRTSDFNVILVYWGPVDGGVYPLTVKTVVPKVGAEVAALVKALVEHRHANEDDFHLIGHSLGSQIAAVAGHLALGPDKGWITGLDPAGPMFEGKDPMFRLDETDASFVEAVHTDAGFLGYLAPLGHVDYYVDGGLHAHPDCGSDLVGAGMVQFMSTLRARG